MLHNAEGSAYVLYVNGEDTKSQKKVRSLRTLCGGMGWGAVCGERRRTSLVLHVLDSWGGRGKVSRHED